MGVEYMHYLIPSNPSFVPDKDVIKRVDTFLRKWGLRSGEPKVYDLTMAANTIVENDVENLIFEHGLALEYPGTDGPIISRIMGDSYYKKEVFDEDRYIMGIAFIVGLDYRIHSSSEELSITMKRPACNGGVPITPHCEFDDLLRFGRFAESFNSTFSTTPPLVDIEMVDKKRIIGEHHFSGYWRVALSIDCGKDLPQLTDDHYVIPNREFVAEFETALGERVIEIGEIY